MRYISAVPDLAHALPWPRRLAVLGSTGSIGRNALRVVEGAGEVSFPPCGGPAFRVEALAAGRNIALLAEQAGRWRPPYLAIQDATGESGVDALLRLLPRGYHPTVLTGPQGYAALAALEGVDMVLSAQAGAAGLRATVAAAAKGKTICLANKESLVLAGDLLRELCARTGAVILPVDSEHGALFQCLVGRRPDDVARLVLTASGGPFRGRDTAFLSTVRPENALRHPNWNMGAKITIDSATLMNKGLEVIEACHLYGVPVDAVDVLIHPQSLVHSLVEMKDGSLMAQLAVPDMRLPIALCLGWPLTPPRRMVGIHLLDLAKAGTLTFDRPDTAAFPCLDLARRALAGGRTVELNAANEVAVERFLQGDIAFTDIPALVRDALDHAERADRTDETGAGLAADTTNKADPATRCVPDVRAAVARIEALDAATRNRAARWHAR